MVVGFWKFVTREALHKTEFTMKEQQTIPHKAFTLWIKGEFD